MEVLQLKVVSHANATSHHARGAVVAERGVASPNLNVQRMGG
jgi:hypothetical protein